MARQAGVDYGFLRARVEEYAGGGEDNRLWSARHKNVRIQALL